jgi:hypothetical protein
VKLYGLLLGILLASTISAAPILVISYDLPNGDGTAQGGTFNYWDDTYNGLGNKTLDRALLSGGTGQLTDNTNGATDWMANLGSGPAFEWVGWINFSPVIIFDFGVPKKIDNASVFANNNQVGGVYLWNSATFSFSNDGVTFIDPIVRTTTPAEKADTSARYIDTPLDATARYVSVTFATGDGPWLFLSEVQFDGSVPGSSVPEPGTLPLLATALGVLLLSQRRHRIHS